MTIRLTFTPGDHIPSGEHLRMNGEPVASVGRIMKAAGFERDFSKIAPDVLAHARERGKYVDECIQALEGDDLDWSLVAPEAKPYLDAYAKFRRERRWTTHWTQPLLYHPTYEYGGLSDLVGVFEGEEHLSTIDVKCVASMKPDTQRGYEMQLRGYTMPGIYVQPADVDAAFPLREDDQPTPGFILWLQKSGKHKLIPCQDPEAREAWDLAAVRHRADLALQRLKAKWAA